MVSFSGAEGFEAKIDPIDLRPPKESFLQGVRAKFMRELNDYRKEVF